MSPNVFLVISNEEAPQKIIKGERKDILKLLYEARYDTQEGDFIDVFDMYGERTGEVYKNIDGLLESQE